MLEMWSKHPDSCGAKRVYGIASTACRRYVMTLINNQQIKVRCVEIRDQSVLIGVEGTTETKEIRLRPGL